MTVTTDEVQRRLTEVLERFEALANRLDMTYVRRDIFDAYKELVATRIEALKTEKEALVKQADTEREALSARVQVLEDDKTTKTRLIWGAFISAFGSVVVAIVLSVVLHHGGG